MIGSVIHSRYEVVKSFGGGSNSTVYRAKDLSLNREVALKIFQGRIDDSKRARIAMGSGQAKK
jgi:serine/threonine protein kinase